MQQVTVDLDAIGIVGVARGQPADPAPLLGLDGIFQLAIGIGVISDEGDLFDPGSVAFRNPEHEIDAIFAVRDRLRIDLSIIATAVVIKLDDALDVGLHSRGREGPLRLGLHFVCELFLLQCRIAFERDLIDHRVLGHDDDDTITRPFDADIAKQRGRLEGFESGVGGAGIELAAGTETKIGADRVGLDVMVALNDDGRCGLGRRGLCGGAGPWQAREQ